MQSSIKILLIDDDKQITSTLVSIFKLVFDIDPIHSGQQALIKTEAHYYDLIILDINLPDISGFEVLKRLRNRGLTTPIFVLSGNSSISEKVKLFECGANDYLTKPFAIGELRVRILALTRQAAPTNQLKSNLSVSGVNLNRNTYSVQRDGKVVRLRRKEFEILSCLMDQAGQVVSRHVLEDSVWPGRYNSWANTLDVHIKYLRDKIDRPFKKPLIRTVHGRGYLFVEEE